ncbi:kinase-like domain-containing protein [Phaeosphaeriaceae sp. PMI808]|nr:kinase-like domain-containing protein [Phaeosphaeriaceae sp. PMI808]
MNATTHHLIPVREGDDLEIPSTKLLPYKRGKVLGKGASAVVAEVKDIITGQVFAQKSFSRYQGQDLARFKRVVLNEANILRRLSSYPHIIRLFATYTSGRQFGMILTPVADGGDLAGYLQAILDSGHHPTTEQYSTLTRAFGCLTSGLTFIHKQTIRHKDIKPANILIHRGYVVYTDFGIALDASQSDSTTTTGIAEAFTRRYCAHTWAN